MGSLHTRSCWRFTDLPRAAFAALRRGTRNLFAWRPSGTARPAFGLGVSTYYVYHAAVTRCVTTDFIVACCAYYRYTLVLRFRRTQACCFLSVLLVRGRALYLQWIFCSAQRHPSGLLHPFYVPFISLPLQTLWYELAAGCGELSVPAQERRCYALNPLSSLLRFFVCAYGIPSLHYRRSHMTSVPCHLILLLHTFVQNLPCTCVLPCGRTFLRACERYSPLHAVYALPFALCCAVTCCWLPFRHNLPFILCCLWKSLPSLPTYSRTKSVLLGLGWEGSFVVAVTRHLQAGLQRCRFNIPLRLAAPSALQALPRRAVRRTAPPAAEEHAVLRTARCTAACTTLRRTRCATRPAPFRRVLHLFLRTTLPCILLVRIDPLDPALQIPADATTGCTDFHDTITISFAPTSVHWTTRSVALTALVVPLHAAAYAWRFFSAFVGLALPVLGSLFFPLDTAFPAACYSSPASSFNCILR